MIDQIEVRERTNSRGQTYPQWFDSRGKMVGCRCDEAQKVHVEKYNWKPCGHMRDWNERFSDGCAINAAGAGVHGTCQMEDEVAHIEDELRKDAERTAYNYFCLAMGI